MLRNSSYAFKLLSKGEIVQTRLLARDKGSFRMLRQQLTIGTKLVTIQQQLGAGAFGIVHKVKEEATAFKYALKDVVCSDPSKSRAGMNEIQTLYKISHESVISLIQDDYLSDNNGFHILILTEYCAGGSLNERLHRPSTNITNFKWMRQAAAGLSYLHTQKVVHRDLKAENVLLTATEDVKIADFGLAREFVAMKTDARLDDDSWLGSYTEYIGSVVGTRHWIAPEVFERRYTEKADVFSLGAIFFAILQRDFVELNGKRFYGAFYRSVVPVPGLGPQEGLGYAMAHFRGSFFPQIIQASFSDGAQGSLTMKSITLAALQNEEKKRPTAAEVQRKLEEVMEEMQFWMREAPATYCTVS